MLSGGGLFVSASVVSSLFAAGYAFGFCGDPNSDIHYIDDMCNAIEDLSSIHSNYVLWVGGDLNLPDIKWPDCTIQGYSYPIDINKHFLDMLLTTHTEQIITTPTRQNNILDIFITSRPSLTPQCHTIPGLGDHHAVSIHSSAQAHRSKPTGPYAGGIVGCEQTPLKVRWIVSSFFCRRTNPA